MDSPCSLRLLQAVTTTDEPRYFKLYNELERIHRSSKRATSGALTLSVKLLPGRLECNRYDSVVFTTAENGPSFYRAVTNSAPSEAVAQLLMQPSNYVAKWIHEAGRIVSYLAVAFDACVYKIYLLDAAAPSFLEGRNLLYLLPHLYRSAYIDCLELNLDQPHQYRHPVYFKLRAPDLNSLFAPGYRPHPQIDNRLLKGIPDRRPIIAALGSLTEGLRRANDPVIKLRYEAGGGSEHDEVDRFSHADYSINVNTFDPSCIKAINNCRDNILKIAEVLACRAPVAKWLEAIRPFDCYLSYLAIAQESVTIYYKTS